MLKKIILELDISGDKKKGFKWVVLNKKVSGLSKFSIEGDASSSEKKCKEKAIKFMKGSGFSFIFKKDEDERLAAKKKADKKAADERKARKIKIANKKAALHA